MGFISRPLLHFVGGVIFAADAKGIIHFNPKNRPLLKGRSILEEKVALGDKFLGRIFKFLKIFKNLKIFRKFYLRTPPTFLAIFVKNLRFFSF